MFGIQNPDPYPYPVFGTNDFLGKEAAVSVPDHDLLHRNINISMDPDSYPNPDPGSRTHF